MSLKTTALKALMPLGLYPHIRFTYSPFKILEFERLLARVEFRGDERVLDIGCGDGLHTLLLARRAGHTTGIDVNSAFVADARDYARAMGDRVRVDFEDRPLETIAFPDAHFDLVFSICVIEHIPNHREVLAECRRILKPGGRIVFTVDTLETIAEAELVERHRRAHHVVQYFRRDSLGALLGELGFADIEFETLFRSDLARRLFVRGIERGFNFGRLRAPRLARELAAAEAAVPADRPGIFLLAAARRPAAE